MEHEAQIRLAFFGGVFLLMALWELAAPRRPPLPAKGRRWSANLGLVLVDTLAVRLVFPLAAVGMAGLAQEWKWGVLNQWKTPYVLAFLASIIALDFIIYLQHVVFHALPSLWRLHMVHHADLDFDVTTGLRFHPLEILLSMAIKLTAVALIGPPVEAVVAFEVLLNATSMFNHSNVRIPPRIDRALRWLVVTPDMHRVHHSIDVSESNHNFGFNLPWWDRLCGTYQPRPAAGHENMIIGLHRFRDVMEQSLRRLLVMPFVREIDDRSIRHRREQR
ncbi:MAG: hypothetical protein AMXMBFR4_15030 [Candidatus Hydrogenedentota bacterium]